MDQVLCIDDNFPPEYIAEFVVAQGVQIPVKGKIYSVRAIKRHFDGNLGVYLDEIRNPQCEIRMNGITLYVEPGFALRRFTDLLGNPLKEEIQEEEEVKQNFYFTPSN